MNNLNLIDNEMKDDYKDKLVGFIDIKMPLLNNNVNISDFNEVSGIMRINEMINPNEIDCLLSFFHANKKEKVSMEAIKKDYGFNENGISRSCFYDKNFAINLTQRLMNALDDNWLDLNGDNYKLIGFNPLFRFIHYKESHRLMPHYDLPVVLDNGVQSCKTLVLYLTTSKTGCTNFLEDSRKNNFNDSFDKFPIIQCQSPKSGLGVIFDHYVFHESDVVKDSEEKIIITTEIFYNKN